MALDLRNGDGNSLAGRADYEAARKAVGADAAGMLFADLSQLRQAPGFLSGLDAPKPEPAAGVVAGRASGEPQVRAVACRRDLPGAAGPSATGVRRWRFRRHGRRRFRPAQGRRARQPSLPRCAARDRGREPLSRPRRILRRQGRVVSATDLGPDLLREHDGDLLQRAESYGRSAGPDAATDPAGGCPSGIRSAVGTPEPQWPAFALVLGLRDAKAFGEVMEEAWQKALGLVNFTRGQKALRA